MFLPSLDPTRRAPMIDRTSRRLLLAILLTSITSLPVAAQISPEQAAEMALTSARKAFNEKNMTDKPRYVRPLSPESRGEFWV